MTYQPTASPLHAARAAVAIAWCLALLALALLSADPRLLGAEGLAVLGAGWAAGVGRRLVRSLRFAVPMWIAIALINALVTQNGLTVIWRFGDLPVLGQTDITLEATVYGLVLGLRAAVLVTVGALYSLAVDPDEVLRLLRRASFRSALTATIATRMVPLLIRDSRRLADAQRCRPGPPPGRATLLRATTSGVFDRALDVAATLELRGFAAAGHASPRGRPARAWSRHDVAFAAAAIALLAVGVGARAGGVVEFGAYPALRLAPGAAPWLIAACLVAVTLLPFADRRGVGR